MAEGLPTRQPPPYAPRAQIMSQPPYGPVHLEPFYLLHYTYAWEYDAQGAAPLLGAMWGPEGSASYPRHAPQTEHIGPSSHPP